MADDAPEPKLEKAREFNVPTHVHDLAVARAEDGRVETLFAACLDGTIRRIDPGDGTHEEIARHDSFATGVHWLPALGQVVSSGYDGRLVWTRPGDGTTVRTVEAHGFWSWQSAVSPDGSMVASATGRYRAGGLKYEPAPETEPSVRVFDTATGEPRHAFEHVPPVESVTFSRDNRFLAAANLMGEIRIWDLSTGDRAATCSTPNFTGWGIIKGHYYTGGIFALAFANGDASLLAAGMGSTRDPAAGNGKQLWERFDWRAEGAPRVAAASDGEIGQGLMETLAFSPDDRHFAMAGRLFKGNWNVALFDTATGGLVASHNSGTRVSRAAFTPNGSELVLAGGVSQKREGDGSYPDFGRITVLRVSA